MKPKNIFLFTAFDIRYPYGGGAIVRDVLKKLQNNENYRLHWVYKEADEDLPPIDDWIEESVTKHPYRLPEKKRFLYTAVDYYVFYRFMPALIKSFKSKIQPGDILWVVLENTNIPLAYELAKQTDTPLHISIHDDCRGFYSPYRQINSDKALQKVFRRTASADFIGHNLLAEYQREFTVNEGLVFRRGMDSESIHVKHPVKKEKYKLLFVGSSHSAECWRILIGRLQQLKSDFEILLLGNTAYVHQLGVDINNLGNVKFIEGGVVNDSEIAEVAQDADFGVFFWEFMPDDRLRFSVSTKFTTYARLGLPVLGLMSPVCELYNLFDHGLATDISQLYQKNFDEWIEAFSANSYKNYIAEYFEQDKMMAGLLGAKAFKV